MKTLLYTLSIVLLPLFCVAQTTYTTNFESGFGDWTQDTDDDIDWTHHSGVTASGSTGPSSASEGEFYIYVESSLPEVGYPYKIAKITSVPYAIGSNGVFTFDYHMHGSTMGELTLYASTNGGSSWGTLWTLEGDQGNSWKEAQVDLSSYNGSTVIFRFIGITGTNYNSDMSIDNIQITSEESVAFERTVPSLSNENYIYTIIPTESTTNVSSLNDNEIIESVQYFDGLGRPMQSIGIRAGGDQEDIVTHIGYDDFGRQDKDYLPYAVESDNSNYGGVYQTGADMLTIDFYDETKYENTTNPYSEKHFEASPLNRVLEQAAPGADWALDKDADTDHTIKFEYDTNTVSEVKLYEVSFDDEDNPYTPTLSGGSTTYCNAGELYKTITKDENWTSADGNNRTTEEFKDKQGQVVLKRTYANVNGISTAHDTYYVYDDFGNLTYVLPPKIDASINNISTVTSQLNDLGYQYVYDNRNRLAQKKIPGKGWEYIVYNKLDQPVLTQDAKQRENKQWLFTKYDAFGRVTYTGIYTHTTKVDQAEMQTALEDYYTNNTTALLYEERSDYTITTNNNYSNTTFPTNNIEVLTVNYYDTYIGLPTGAPTAVTLLGSETNETNTTQVKGLPTVSKVKVLETDDWITTVTYYDDKARPVYVYSYNEYLETIDIIETKYDFINVIETKTTHKRVGTPYDDDDDDDDDDPSPIYSYSSNIQANLMSTTSTVESSDDIITYDNIIIIDYFEYDHMGRLLSQKQKIGSQAEELIVLNNYDELGQLESKKVGGEVASNIESSTGLQTIDYTYNIRGWLKQINDPESLGSDLFSLGLNYNTSSHGGTTLFNGNISETEWKTANSDANLKWYKYNYDALNRITGGKSSTNQHDLGSYDELGDLTTPISYDKNGNITHLIRRGHIVGGATTPDISISSHFGEMDNLDYSYDSGNKLMKVSDTGDNTYGFKDDYTGSGADPSDDYTYDLNGNMIKDLNKEITSIAYNYLNLPTSIITKNNNVFQGGGAISYVYDATGVKQSKTVSGAYTTVKTKYAGNFIYEDRKTIGYGGSISSTSKLKFFNHPEGYAEPKNESDLSQGFNYVYQYKDHLGNVRLSYSDIDGNGDINADDNHVTIWEDGFESASGWDKSVVQQGWSISGFDSNFKRSGSYSGFLGPYGNSQEIYSYSSDWVLVSDTESRDYVFSGWVYLENVDGNSSQFYLMMRQNPESGNFSSFVNTVNVTTKGQWVYIEKQVTIPANRTALNFRIDNNHDGKVWFDDLKIVRVDSTNSSEIVEENNYYPFGLKHKGYNSNITSTNIALKKKFGGMEYQDEFGLGWYDVSARNYDPALGRWMNLDPLAEAMRRHSPYNYAFNNPISFIDPDGMAPDWINNGDGTWTAQAGDSASTLARDANISFDKAKEIMANTPKENSSLGNMGTYIDPKDGVEKSAVDERDVVTVSEPLSDEARTGLAPGSDNPNGEGPDPTFIRHVQATDDAAEVTAPIDKQIDSLSKEITKSHTQERAYSVLVEMDMVNPEKIQDGGVGAIVAGAMGAQRNTNDSLNNMKKRSKLKQKKDSIISTFIKN